jgi:kanamycin kinase
MVVRRLSDAEEPQVVWTNERGGLTFRVGDSFVKWNPHATGLDLEAERLRLEWAIRWHPVPKVLDWGADHEAQWLVTSALPGESAVTVPWRTRPLDAARTIGKGLRMLHDALPAADCPFDWSVETRIGHRIPAERLGAPLIDRLVVCHGDACSPNTSIAPDGSLAGHVDLGSLGVADRWADLAVASMNLDYNFGPGWEDAFFAAYGIARDEERILFYRFLWENEDKVGLPPHSAR